MRAFISYYLHTSVPWGGWGVASRCSPAQSPSPFPDRGRNRSGSKIQFLNFKVPTMQVTSVLAFSILELVARDEQITVCIMTQHLPSSPTAESPCYPKQRTPAKGHSWLTPPLSSILHTMVPLNPGLSSSLRFRSQKIPYSSGIWNLCIPKSQSWGWQSRHQH